MKWQVLRPSEAHRGTGPHGQKCGRIPDAAQTPSGALISTEWPLAHSENSITNQALIFTHHWRGRIWLWGPQNKLGNKKLWCRIQSSARNMLPIGPLPIKWGRRGNWFLVKQKLYKLALCFPMTNYPQCRHSTPLMIGQARHHCLLHSSYKWSSSPDNFSHKNYYLDIQMIYHHFGHSNVGLSQTSISAWRKDLGLQQKPGNTKPLMRASRRAIPPEVNSPWVSQSLLFLLADQYSFFSCWLF